MTRSVPPGAAAPAPLDAAAPGAAWTEHAMDDASALDAWERLAARHARSPFAEPFWQRAWWRHFGGPGAGTRLHLLVEDRAAHAALPLRRRGRFVRVLAAPFNPHVPYVDAAFQRPPAECIGALLDQLVLGADAIEFAALRRDGELYPALRHAAAIRRAPVFEWRRPDSLILPIDGGPDALRARLSHNLVQSTRRKRRQLEREGALEYQCAGRAALRAGGQIAASRAGEHSAASGAGEHGAADGPLSKFASDPSPQQSSAGVVPARLEKVLEECLLLEQASWKGARGSAMASRPQTRRFYTEVAAEAARRGMLGLYTLRLDGRLIAFELCLRHSGAIHLLKLSFADERAAQSPGSVLRLLLLEDEAARGECAEYDFGIDSEWKRRWTQVPRPLSSLTIFAPHVRGRLAHRLGPRLRAWLKRNPLVASVVSALRSKGRRSTGPHA